MKDVEPIAIGRMCSPSLTLEHEFGLRSTEESPPLIAGLSADDDAEWIDTEQRGLVLRVRGRRLVWFVRYLYEGSARRYRIGTASEIGLSAARKLASTIRGRADGGQDPQQEKRGKREAARKRRLGHRTQRPCLLAQGHAQRSARALEG